MKLKEQMFFLQRMVCVREDCEGEEEENLAEVPYNTRLMYRLHKCILIDTWFES